jgi:hypothetical protein
MRRSAVPFLVLLAAAGALPACTTQQMFGLPPAPSPEFGVSALTASNLPPDIAAFNNVQPQAAAMHANNICTLGYRTVQQKAIDATYENIPGEITADLIACKEYVPFPVSLF